MKGCDVLTRLHLLWPERRVHGVYYNRFCVNCDCWMKRSMKEKPGLTLNRKGTKITADRAIQPVPKQAKRAMSLSHSQPSSSALWEHAYSACLTRTNDGPPSAYMLTAVSCPHPGNDCVINPELLFKLLLTAEGENGINCLCSPVTNAPLRTVWATLAIRHCQRRTWDGVGLHVRRPQSGLQEPSHGSSFMLLMLPSANHFTVCAQQEANSLHPEDQRSLAPCPKGGQLAETMGGAHSFPFHHHVGGPPFTPHWHRCSHLF